MSLLCIYMVAQALSTDYFIFLQNGRSQARNPKHQTPNPKKIPNSKTSQIPNPKSLRVHQQPRIHAEPLKLIGAWDLVFGISFLVLIPFTAAGITDFVHQV